MYPLNGYRSAVSRLTILGGILLSSAALAQDNALDEVIKAAEFQRAKLQSAQVTMTVRTTQTEAFARLYEITNPQEDKTHTVEWAFKGEKLFREHTQSYDTTQQKNVRNKLTAVKTTSIYDGKDGYDILTESNTGGGKPRIQGNIDRHRTNEFSPLDIGYKVDTQWLAETLKARQFRYIDTSEDATFGTLLHFADEEQNGKRLNVWIAPKFGYLAVRSRSDTAMHGRKQALLMETKRIERKGEVWFPTEGSMKSFETENGSDNLLTEQTLTVTKWEANNVSDSKFVPNLPVGAHMRDGETRVAWRIGSNGEKIYKDTDNQSGQSSFLPSGFSTVIVAILLVLTIIAYIRWKRKQSVQTV